MRPVFLLFLLSIASSIFALDPRDSEKINQMIEHFATAWNVHEGHGFADGYAADADFVNIYGMTFSGKEEIEIRHIKILQTFLKGSTFEIVNVKLREVTPELVIAHVSWNVSNIAENMHGLFTHVFLKNNGQWEIIASQNTRAAS